MATLNSLTPDGGVVPLLDIIIERAFPCGYVDMSKGRQHETWNAEEERTKADEWTVSRAFLPSCAIFAERVCDSLARESDGRGETGGRAGEDPRRLGRNYRASSGGGDEDWATADELVGSPLE